LAVRVLLGVFALAVGLGLLFASRPMQPPRDSRSLQALAMPPQPTRLPRVLLVLPHREFWYPDYASSSRIVCAGCASSSLYRFIDVKCGRTGIWAANLSNLRCFYMRP
jgi:hypothetical protein